MHCRNTRSSISRFISAHRITYPGREKRRMNAFRTNFRTRSELVARTAFVCSERVPRDVRNAIKVFRTRYLYRSIWVLLTFIVIANANFNRFYTGSPVALIKSTFIFVQRCRVQFFLKHNARKRYKRIQRKKLWNNTR